jgi:cation:H+ antiporter
MILLTAAAVVIAGVLLGRSADAIAQTTGLGNVWTGWLLLAAATSLPEFVTDVNGVRLHAPNLAAGDLFGSSLTNMAFFAVIIWGRWRTRETPHASSSTVMTAMLAIVLSLLGAIFTLLHPGWSIGRFRGSSALLLGIYLAGTLYIYRRQAMQAHHRSEPSEVRKGGPMTPRWAFMLFAAGAVTIFFAAPSLVIAARRFAESSGLGESFIGTTILGFSTALPEFVTSITACRLGAFDLAASNLFGSCAFNMVVFFAMDLASPVPVFSLFSPSIAISGFLSVALMCIALRALARRGDYHIPALDGGLIMAGYLIAIWIDYICGLS